MEDRTTGSEVCDSGHSSPNEKIAVTVKFKGRTIPVNVSPESTVKDLKSLLLPITDVLPRGQKLICKGKLLNDDMTLTLAEVKNGSKIMLLPSQGLHQGGGPILKEAQTRPISRKIIDANQAINEKIEVPIDKSRLERWKVTGVIALSECNLKAIPDEVWACGPSTRLLDISKNSIRDVPNKVSGLSSLQKMLLNANDLLDKSISWEGLTSLRYLTVLNLSCNQLMVLPSALCAISSLEQLYISSNILTILPTEMGLLTRLQILKANNNRISTIPTSIGDCISLIQVDFSENLVAELPETIGNLRNLKALHLSNNSLKSLPSIIFKMCSQLTTLDLHNTEITLDILRQFEGWEDFDERRRLKHQKQLDFRVVGSAEFDEGGDKN